MAARRNLENIAVPGQSGRDRLFRAMVVVEKTDISTDRAILNISALRGEGYESSYVLFLHSPWTIIKFPCRI